MPRRTPPDPERDQAKAFPAAAETNERIRSNPGEYPTGWVQQAEFRHRYDLPPFRPPRFADGETVREVVERLEAELGCDVSFVTYDVAEGWLVEVDGGAAFRVDRHRDDAANTVLELPSDEFESRVERAADRGD